MRAGLALVLLAFGCGGSPKPQPAPPPPPPPATPPTAAITPGAKATPQQVCHRIMELKTQGCGMFKEANFDEPGCLKELEASAGDPMIEVFTSCVVQPACEEVTNCIVAAAQKAQEQQQSQQATRECKDTSSMAAVGLPKAEFDKRNGAGATKFSQVKSTKDLPAEMCGIEEENRWLESLACDDGSRPVQNAELVRKGNVGAGGRCGSIIDQYEVQCPGSKTYPIFIDAYVCPKS